MSIQQDFLVFGGAAGANVITQGSYAAMGARTGGFSAGVAPSAAVNKPIRQASIMAAAIGEMIAYYTNTPVVDDGTTNAIENGIALLVRVLGAQYINSAQILSAGAYDVDTSAGPLTLPLPATPSAGRVLTVTDVSGTWGTNPLTLARNGNTILGSATDLVCDIPGETFKIWFNGSDWRLF